MFFYYTLAAVLALAIIHVFANKLRFLGGLPRSIWLSAAGGVSVAYVFLHLFPELHEGQEVMAEIEQGWLSSLKHHVYLLALAGLVFFYGIERWVISKKGDKSEVAADEDDNAVFWVHIFSFSVYNAMLGYVFHTRENQSLSMLVLFFIAIGLHFIVNDFGLQEHHAKQYIHKGRWVLSLSILLGWGIALFWEISEEAIVVLLAFLAGGIVLNVLKEELPSERKSRFWAFLLGAGGYSILLLSL